MSGYDALFAAYDLVYRIGAPIAVAAWLTVFAGAIALGRVLRGRMRGLWGRSLFVAGLAVAGHTADIGMTLHMSPDLELEGNPIWLVVVERWGLDFALAYGITGQVLVCFLSGQLFAWYLLQRESLHPSGAATFLEYVRRCGERAPRRFGIAWRSTASLFAFLFATLGPFSFYIAFLNSMVLDGDAWHRWPSPLTAALAYLGAQVLGYFWLGWRAYGKTTGAFSGAGR